jgi:hypothetical protein
MLLWMVAAMGQDRGSTAAAAPSTMQMTIVGTSLKASDGKIYVNQACEIFPGLTLPLTTHKPKGEWIPEVCHLENVENSERHDEKAAGGELERANVEVREQEYVLQNVSLKPAVFAVLEQVPEGWSVDSDPKPGSMDGPVAIFEVHAGPWETVRLHVGLRHERELKPKVLPPKGADGR